MTGIVHSILSKTLVLRVCLSYCVGTADRLIQKTVADAIYQQCRGQEKHHASAKIKTTDILRCKGLRVVEDVLKIPVAC